MGKTSAVTNLIPLIGPAVLSLLLWLSFTFVDGAGVLPSFVLKALSSMGGLALLVAAKLPLLRTGRWISFGPGGLSQRGRALYFSGWSLIALSALIGFGIFFAPGQA